MLLAKMKSTRIVLPLVLGLALFSAGCILLGVQHDKIATYQKIGDRYLIEVTGVGIEWSHDLTQHSRVKESWQFDVPRIDGKIDGREIRQRQGFLPYVGTISIQDNVMTVSLSADNYYYKQLEKEEWNGRYTLVEKK